ncbi:MAG TPA: 6-bladed beta-propeller [Candidatus Saccharicenans sp.]|mgnify:CR=1 FL=1|jgi:hypothetical protein|nr:6-bladed beta-propeller [Candidatus Saccharicenans sp.]HOP61016.1 6-bladed beta-propeller [Candidatus Saccharicenans sp.]HPU93872.1 6-bladed beta-propeller [Candidatus Saccharicenans sp.]HQM74892.1 6-bladed beta-propeller [Candidatus Saccharicenans sp.]
MQLIKRLSVILGIILLLTSSVIAREEKSINVTGKIIRFKSYKGDLYFLNATEGNVWRFDKDLNYLNTIGKKGDGPGEIRGFSDFNFLDSNLYILNRQKVLIFSLNGDLIKEEKIKSKNQPYLPLKHGYYLAKETNILREKGKTIVQKISFLDGELNEKTVVLNEQLVIPPGYEFEFPEPIFEPGYCETTGLVYIPNASKEYLIFIYKEDGNRSGIINKRSQKTRVTERYRKKTSEILLDVPWITSQEMAKAVLKSIHFRRYFPPFHSIYLDDEGNLYVRTFKTRNNKTGYDKYSKEGTFIKEYFLNEANINIVDANLFISFASGNFYYMYEKENGDYILSCEKLD